MSDNPIRRSALAGRATDTDATTAVKAPDSIVFNRVSVTYGRGKKSTDALRDFTLRARRGLSLIHI